MIIKNNIHSSLTSKEVEEELNRVVYRLKYKKILKSTIYSLIIIVAFAVLIATFIMPVLEINNSSMKPNLFDSDIVLSVKKKKFKNGDVIAFYHGNKILVKRVIANAGSWVSIDNEGNVYVDNILLEEPYLVEKSFGESNIDFPYQVPDGSYFVLSDERANSLDSRNLDIGCVSNDNVIGKIVFRIWPLDKFGFTG